MADLGLSSGGLSSPKTPCSGIACARACEWAEDPKAGSSCVHAPTVVPIAVDSLHQSLVVLKNKCCHQQCTPTCGQSTFSWEEGSQGVCVRMALPQNRKAWTGLEMWGAEGVEASPGVTSVLLRAQQSVFLIGGTKCGYIQNKVILTSNHLFFLLFTLICVTNVY